MNRNGERAGRRLGVRWLALVLGSAMTTTGCSFIWVTRPVPKEEAREYLTPPPCTDSYWMPALDTAALALFGGFATYFASMSKEQYLAQESSSSSNPDPNGRFYAAASMGTLALTGLASAIYGYHYVAKCKKQEPIERDPETSFARQRFPGPPVPVPPPPGFATVQVRGKHMAVLEFQGKDLDPDILMTFSDTVRGGTLQALEPYGVVVMTRENMLVLLRDMGKKECGEGDCEVETARNIGADYVISGKVVRVEQSYFVTLKLHETQGGSLLGTDTVEGASQVELLRALREHARQLTAAAFGPGQDPGLPTR
jgi:TolB-like protein